MPFIRENYPISTNREETAIAGLSIGGKEALYIEFSLPEIFGYIGAFSPASRLLPFSSPSCPSQITALKMTISDEYKKNTFILICNGNQDGVVNNVPYEYHRTMSDNGIKHLYYTIDGAHDFNV